MPQREMTGSEFPNFATIAEKAIRSPQRYNSRDRRPERDQNPNVAEIAACRETLRRDGRRGLLFRRTANRIASVTEAAQKICEIGRRAYQRGLIAGGEGNISVRLDDHHLLATPTGVCKGFLNPDDLAVVDLEGRQVSGRPRSSEILLHAEIYRCDPRVRAVVHTHPPFATTFTILGESLPPGVLPEAEVFLGHVPLVPYATPGTCEIASAIRPHVSTCVAALLQNHGAITWGPDLESAYLLTETLESVCRVVYQARQIGVLQFIPAEKLGVLADLRSRLRGE